MICLLENAPPVSSRTPIPELLDPVEVLPDIAAIPHAASVLHRCCSAWQSRGPGARHAALAADCSILSGSLPCLKSLCARCRA